MIIKRIKILIVILFVALPLFGCVNGSVDNSDNDFDKDAVYIRINKPTATTRYEEPVGNESKITTLSFFFFDEAGAKVYGINFSESDLYDGINQPKWTTNGIIRLSSLVRESLSRATSVYVVANEQLQGVLDKQSLLTKIISGLPQSSMDNFVMTGHRENGVTFNPDDAPMVVVQISRLVTKIRLNVLLASPETLLPIRAVRWGDELSYVLRHQINNSYVITNNSACDLNIIQHTDINDYFFQNGYSPFDVIAFGGQLPMLEFYTYEHYWKNEGNDDNGTYFILQLPYMNVSGKHISDNFYKIYLDIDSIARNQVYDVHVSITTLGTLSANNPTMIKSSDVVITNVFHN